MPQLFFCSLNSSLGDFAKLTTEQVGHNAKRGQSVVEMSL